MRITGIILFMVLVAGCSPKISVTVQEVNDEWHNLRTYKYIHPDKIPPANFTFSDEEKQLLFQSVANELTERGFRSVKEADLVIKIQGGRFQYSERQSVNRDPFFNPYYNPYLYGNPVWDDRDTAVKEVHLIIEIYDATTRNLYWWGTANKQLESKEGLIEMVDAIFNEFPIQPDNTQKGD
jgi:hypothetical protein